MKNIMHRFAAYVVDLVVFCLNTVHLNFIVWRADLAVMANEPSIRWFGW